MHWIGSCPQLPCNAALMRRAVKGLLVMPCCVPAAPAGTTRWSHGLLEVPCSSQHVPGASSWPHPDAKRSLQSAVGLRVVANCCWWPPRCWQTSVGRALAVQRHPDVIARGGLADSHLANQTLVGRPARSVGPG